ncbi:MAG: hypothetical protein EZS28_036015 [Streblomastix strix]|uniref:RNase H type-1 domain-containing protein n=1 Tax=Streblomastix strix TaxID=222440 RepID=A0A5J4UCY9_9EUKA|nr:MAG: hypothetical protein EZS28_036015 [Streblomastix strix]
MQPQLLKTSPQNAPQATRPVQDPRNRNKDSTQKTRQKQSPIPRLTNRFSWTEEERDQERREGRDLENYETDKENREILDRNGGINSEIFRIMGNNQHERHHPIRIYTPVERRLEYQQPITIVKDYEVQRDRGRSKRTQDNVGRVIEREICNTDQKGINQMVQPDIHDKESKRKMENDTRCESFEQTDSRLPLQDARFDRGKTNNQIWGLGHFTRPHIRISPSNSPSRITTIPSIRVPKQPLHIQSNAIWNQTLTDILCNSNGTDNVTNKNENRDQNNQLPRRYPSPPPEQGVSKEHDLIGDKYTEVLRVHNEHRKQRDSTESNSNIPRMGMESSKRNSQNKIEEAFSSPTRFIQYEKMNKDGNRNNSKINSEANRKTKLSKTVILRSHALPEHNGSSESISCKTERMEYNDDNEQNGNPRYKLVDSETQGEHSSKININTTTNDNDNRCSTKWMGFNIGEKTGNDSNGSWNLEQKISEVIKQQQGNQSYNLRLMKFRNTAVFDIRKWRASTSLIKEIKQVHQTIEKLGIQIQITHLPGVRNEIADALSRLSRAGDYKLKEKIFRQICLQMNLNPTIDLFSQHFNNLLPRFMSTIGGHGETAKDALNQTWKKELPWIHPPIPLLPAVLKKIIEEQIEAMIIAPLWPGQIWYTELVNENAQSLMLGWSNEILGPGTSLIKKNLKLPPGKIYCFLMDRRPGREEDLRERF